MSNTGANSNVNAKIEEAKSGLLYSGLSCVGLLALGGIITGITYSMAEPGGTYTVTTGAFLFAGISGIIAIWRLMQLCFYLSKRGVQHRTNPPAQVVHRQMHRERTWSDLE
jgi:hypothetical protein